MRKLILTSIILLFAFAAYTQYGSFYKQNSNEDRKKVESSQELMFDIHGMYSRSVKQEKLIGASFIGDLIYGYPKTWIVDYISSEVSVTCNGKTRSAMSKNDSL